MTNMYVVICISRILSSIDAVFTKLSGQYKREYLYSLALCLISPSPPLQTAPPHKCDNHRAPPQLDDEDSSKDERSTNYRTAGILQDLIIEEFFP